MKLGGIFLAMCLVSVFSCAHSQTVNQDSSVSKSSDSELLLADIEIMDVVDENPDDDQVFSMRVRYLVKVNPVEHGKIENGYKQSFFAHALLSNIPEEKVSRRLLVISNDESIELPQIEFVGSRYSLFCIPDYADDLNYDDHESLDNFEILESRCVHVPF